jgi:hypothetical protein
LLLQCDSELLKSFGALGSNDVDLASLVESLSRFVALKYGSKLEKIEDIRWDRFCRGTARAELLPPICAAFVYYFKRAHYCANAEVGKS